MPNLATLIAVRLVAIIALEFLSLYVANHMSRYKMVFSSRFERACYALEKFISSMRAPVGEKSRDLIGLVVTIPEFTSVRRFAEMRLHVLLVSYRICGCVLARRNAKMQNVEYVIRMGFSGMFLQVVFSLGGVGAFVAFV